MLIQGNCVKRFTAVSTDQLEANSGESFLIKGIYVAPVSGNDYLTLKVDRKTVGVYRILGRAGNHLDRMQIDYVHKNLMEFLVSKDVNCTIPIAEGQSFTVSTTGNTPVVVIVYDRYSAGDIRADMPNGTDAKEYMFMQYMDYAATIAASSTVELNVSLSPAEFPDFPCGKSVPANTEIDILGLVGCPCGTGISASSVIGSSYVKLVKERETLFDEDRNGIPFFYQWGQFGGTSYWSDFSLIGPCCSLDTSTYNVTLGNPLMFDPPLKFRAGEELLVYMSFVLAGTRTLALNSIDLAAIMNVKVT